MQKKTEKGVTLMALAITIIILIILASITAYSGKSAIDSSKLLAFSTQMKVMQAEVDVMNQELINGNQEVKNYGEDISNFSKSEEILNLAEIYNQIEENTSLSEEEKTTQKQALKNGFRYYTLDTMKELNIPNVNEEVLVNVENRIVVSCKGIEYEGKTYYTLDKLPDNLYKVQKKVD